MTEVKAQRLVGFDDFISRRNERLFGSQVKSKKMICEDVTKFLYRIGIYPDAKEKRFNYMYTAILTCIENVSKKIVMEDVYKEVARCHGTTIRNVETEINLAFNLISNTPGWIGWKKEILGKEANRNLRSSQAIVFMAKYLK